MSERGPPPWVDILKGRFQKCRRESKCFYPHYFGTVSGEDKMGPITQRGVNRTKSTKDRRNFYRKKKKRMSTQQEKEQSRA